MTLPLDPAPHDSASAALPAGSEPEVVAATIVDEPAPLRGHLGLAWGAILLMTVLIVAGMQLRPSAQSERFEKDDPAAAEVEEEEESA
ncbi:MAG: hypothetical protein JNG90_09175, partial [Planctomycetaceae bacterium]|nr:hypothetical protein [Planctomycetaceae bacterium]